MRKPNTAAAGSRPPCEVLIATIAKNTIEQLRVTWKLYKGHELIDVRVYSIAKNGDAFPTKKGVTFRVVVAKEVVSAISRALTVHAPKVDR